jgi:heptosyltransferase III
VGVSDLIETRSAPAALLVHHGALGDWVLTWPVLRALTRRGGVLAGSSWGKAQLAAAVIDRVQPLDAESAAFTRLLYGSEVSDRVQPLATQLAGLDTIVLFASGSEQEWTAPLRQLAPGATVYSAQSRPGADWRQPLHQWYARQLGEQGLALEFESPPVRANPGGPLLIHPGSGGLGKCWPIDRFERLIEHLRRTGRQVAVVVGEVEAERWPAVQLQRWQAEYGAAVVQSFAVLRQMLLDACGFIGNDSGPSHLAGQLGLPTLALFGPTLPQVWAPVGPAVRVLAPPEPCDMTWLSVEQVIEHLGPPMPM